MRRVGDHGKHISIRFDTETHDKLFYIAEYEGRKPADYCQPFFYWNASQSSRPQARKNCNSCSPATCASENILLSPQMWTGAD